MKTTRYEQHGNMESTTTVDQAKQFWAEWFTPLVGAAIVGFAVIECDQDGFVPCFQLRMPDGTCRWLPLNENPEGVLGTGHRVHVPIQITADAAAYAAAFPHCPDPRD